MKINIQVSTLALSLLLNLLLGNALFAAVDYRLGSGDKIKITVYDEPELSLDFIIDENGLMSYPFIGKVQLINKTLDEVRTDITKRLKDGYLINPEVSVIINSYRSYFVNGEVQKADAFQFQPGMTVGKAISISGGFSIEANRERILLQRLNWTNAKVTTMDTLVEPGDIITIEKYLRVYANGRVNNPGDFPYQPGMTVEKVIAMAGGLDPRADIDDIQVKSLNNPTVRKIDLQSEVQPGDIIEVKRSFF